MHEVVWNLSHLSTCLIMIRLRPLTTPIRIFRRHASRTSGFRQQEYKRLDYPKAPTLLKEVPPEVRALAQTPAEEFTVKRHGRNKAGRKKATKKLTFASQKDALEFELAPADELRKTQMKRLESLREAQAEYKADMEAQVARNDGVFAVRRGLVPGIYLHWDKVVRETARFSSSEWQKLDTVEEAQEWMGMYHVSPEDVCYDPYLSKISFFEKLLSEESKLEPEETRWYAVKRGRTTGVFSNWEEAADQVVGVTGAVYASFPSDEEAYEYLGVTKKEYFDSLEQTITETDKEMVRQQHQSAIQRHAYQQEQDRIKFTQYAEAKMYVGPPKGGSSNRVKQLLTKSLQIQAQINKMIQLDKMRKFTIQDIFEELNQMTKEEKQKCRESLDSPFLVDAFDVFNDPEFWDFYREYLASKDNYMAINYPRRSKFWKELPTTSEKTEEEEEMDIGPTTASTPTTEELSTKKASKWSRKEKTDSSNELEQTQPTASTENFFSSTQELSEQPEPTSEDSGAERKLTQQDKLQIQNAATKEGQKEGSEDESAATAPGTSSRTKSEFGAWLDGFSESEKPKSKSPPRLTRGTSTDPFTNMSAAERKKVLAAREGLKVDLIAKAEDPSSNVTMDMLAEMTCNCGEPIYVRNRNSSGKSSLVPRRVFYINSNKYNRISSDSGWTTNTFRHKQADFDINTTSFRDHHDQRLLRLFENNWRVLFNSISRQLKSIAANHVRRYDQVEANVVYTDGSHRVTRSPAIHDVGKAGWGVHFEGGLLPDAYGRVPGEETADRAEILAMAMAIRIISRDSTYRTQKWEIRTDSLWTVRLLEEGWEGLEPTERMRSHPNYYLIKRLRALFYENQNISLRFINSRDMYHGAHVADQLAKKGAHMKYSDTAEKYGTDDEDVFITDPALRMYSPPIQVPLHLRSRSWLDNNKKG